MHQHQLSELQKLNNHLSATQSFRESKIQVPFGLMLKSILPQLHNEKASQLRSLYHKLSNNEISRDGFLRLMKNIVGNQILKEAFEKALNQMRLQPSTKASRTAVSAVQVQTNRMPSDKGGYGYMTEFEQPSHSRRMHSSLASVHVGLESESQKMAECNSSKNQSSETLLSGNTSEGPKNSVSYSMTGKLCPTFQVSFRSASVGLETKVKVPPKRHLDQEKPTEEYTTPLSLARKRQRISEIGFDESIEQLNDVTAFTGINLEEEEEMLFTGPKVGSEASNSSQRVVVEEEDGILFLQRSHLQEKLARITSKFGIKSTSKDVELCLSMSVEGRMRGLISNLLRMSRQRVDFEKTRHQISVTSDFHHQIVVMNQKDKDLEKQEVEKAEKLRKLKNEREKWIFDENSETLPDDRNSKLESGGGEIRAGGDIDNNVDSPETPKASKAERMMDDSLLIAAANIAIQAFVGGDDLASKWKLMAKKARQTEARFGARVGEKMINMPSKASGNVISYRQESLGAKNRFKGDHQEVRVRHAISIKDVLAVLQREPQMSKSTYIYSLYERLNTAAV